MSEIPPPPTVSPDGKFYWDGHAWQPMPLAPDSAPATPTAQPRREIEVVNYGSAFSYAVTSRKKFEKDAKVRAAKGWRVSSQSVEKVGSGTRYVVTYERDV